jgi:hypothetical protein
MNWLGKVFVVLILIMSLVFMGLAMAVYATHKNWKEVIDGPNGLQKQLQEARTQFDQLKAQYDRREAELTAEVEAEKQQAVKLEAERVSLAERNVAIQTELDQLKQTQRENTALVAATEENNKVLASQVAELRQQIRATEATRDKLFEETLVATEKLHQVTGQYESAREMSEQLNRDLVGKVAVMDAHGIDPKTDPSGVVPTVDGLVSQVRRSAGAQFVEVTIGADDGLKPGTTVEVFRGDRYLGRLNILTTSPDKSVGRVDRRYQTGQIQEGDRVATRLRL